MPRTRKATTAPTPAQLDLLPEQRPDATLADVALGCISVEPGLAPDPALYRSITRLGVLQPVILEPMPGIKIRFSVVDGRRRVLAAQAYRAAQPETAPPIIRALILTNGAVRPDIVRLTSHALRTRNPAVELRAIERLMGTGASEGDVARATGLTVSEVRARLQLQRLVPELRAALDAGTVAVSVLDTAARLPAERQDRLAAQLAETGHLRGQDVRAAQRARQQTAVAALDFGSAGGESDNLTVAVPPAPAYAKLAAYVRAALGFLGTGELDQARAALDDLARIFEGLATESTEDGHG